VSLTTRLSGFFLAALAVVLLGFSLALYLLARTYLVRQTDARLTATLDALAAAAEIQANGVEWEPAEHRFTNSLRSEPDHVRWVIFAGGQNVIDQSVNSTATDWRGVFGAAHDGDLDVVRVAQLQGEPWHVIQRRLQPGPPVPGDGEFRQSLEPASRLYPQLDLWAAASLAPVTATLSQLLNFLLALSAGIWLVAAVLGRWLCRRALVPVIRMADSAGAMKADDLGQRLPNPQTGDEVEALGNAFNGLLTRLQEAFERQRGFTGDASHQLRTPLTAMLGQLEVVLRRERSAAEYRDALAHIAAQAEHLRQIVEMLLFLARADGEASLAELVVIDLSAWLPEHVQEWSSHLRAPTLHLKMTQPEGLWVRVQPALLGQLLDNLIDNACKYSSAVSPIKLRLDADVTGVMLSVEDQGAGIAPEDLPHIFEPFYRSARARRQGRPGVGLGLAVARRIAEVFDGQISVSSVVGQGTRFVLRLPRAVPTEEPMPGRLEVTGA
jgi:signal transduction histidine kinase